MLSWADEPLTSPRRFAFDNGVFVLLGLAAHLLLDIDWMVIPVLIAGRCAVAAIALLRRRTASAQG